MIALSIFVPVAVATGLTWWVLRGGRRDPDELRLRRAQEAYERQRREERD